MLVIQAFPSLPYNNERDKVTLLLNPDSIRTFSLQLADVVYSVLRRGQFPIVLGGDCSILLGNLLALRRLGRYGLFFIDGHADFYQPEASLTGEVADMDLAIASYIREKSPLGFYNGNNEIHPCLTF